MNVFHLNQHFTLRSFRWFVIASQISTDALFLPLGWIAICVIFAQNSTQSSTSSWERAIHDVFVLNVSSTISVQWSKMLNWFVFFFLPLALRTKRAMQYMNEQLVEITDLEMESVPTIKENSKLCCCKSNNNDQDQQQKKQKYKNARWPMHTSWPKCISFHYYIEPGHTCNSNTFRWTTDWFTTAVFMLMVMLSSFVHVPPFVCVHCTFCIRLFFSTSFFCFDNYLSLQFLVALSHLMRALSIAQQCDAVMCDGLWWIYTWSGSKSIIIVERCELRV